MAPKSRDVAAARAKLAGFYGGGHRTGDDPEVIAAREALRAAKENAAVAEMVENVVTNWPRLNGAQLERIERLFDKSTWPSEPQPGDKVGDKQ